MTPSNRTASNSTPSPAEAQPRPAESKPPEVVEILAKVEQHLGQGQPKAVLDAIGRAGIASPWTTCALGVCQLRLGNAKMALDLFRSLVLAAGGLVLRRDVPVVFRTNYATALCLSGNLAGGLTVLNEIGDEQNPAVDKLRQAIRRWEKGLSFWQRINWWMGGEPGQPFAPDFPPGDLE